MSERRRRGRGQGSKEDARLHTPEIVSLVISSIIVLTLLGVLIYLQRSIPPTPALIEARAMLGETQQEGELFYVPIEIENRGGKAGEEITVRLAMTDASGAEHTAELTIGFLAAGESVKGMVALRSDPRGQELNVSTIGYLEAG
jgi:uncharacterized protein (TIGR02588 family)